ncbi:aspartate kinase domain protein, partial [Vibrio cholerae HC-17A1]
WRKSSMASAKCGLSRLMKTILCSKSKKVKTRWLSTAVTISQSHWYYVVTARVLK